VNVETVRAFLADKASDIVIIDLPTSAATVVLAAEAHGVEPGRSKNHSCSMPVARGSRLSRGVIRASIIRSSSRPSDEKRRVLAQI
jgi:hypothetical protein